jgi:hypothetical protein
MDTSLSDIADIKTILGGITAGSLILTSAGLVPKVGLVRAFVLGWKSIFSFPNTISVRQNDIKNLYKSISTLSRGNYIVVTGGKGFGKTCLVQTVLRFQFGVINIEVRVNFNSIKYLLKKLLFRLDQAKAKKSL